MRHIARVSDSPKRHGHLLPERNCTLYHDPLLDSYLLHCVLRDKRYI